MINLLASLPSRFFVLVLLNVVFIIALWHVDVSHQLDRLGQKRTRGIFRISPEKAFRLSQYVLILDLLLFDIYLIFV